MPRYNLITPTLAEVTSVHLRIPSLVWSPDERNNDAVVELPGGEVSVNRYDGWERAPRACSVMLHSDRVQPLPADARLYIEVKVLDEIRDEATGEIIEPAHYERIATLTPTNREWRRSFPIDDVRVVKPLSDVPYGAVTFGLFGTQSYENK